MSNEIQKFNGTILIYNNELQLKNPKDKYRLITSETEYVQYEFQEKVFKDEIYQIKYYNILNEDNKAILDSKNYTIDEEEEEDDEEYENEEDKSTNAFDKKTKMKAKH